MNTAKRTFILSISLLLFGSLTHAATLKFGGPIDASQSGTGSTAAGSATLLLDTESNTFDLTIHIGALTNEITLSHIHAAPAGDNGPVIVDIGAADVYEVLGSFYAYRATDVAFPPEELANLLAGDTYLNFHTEAFPAGEVRGQLAPMEMETVTIANMSTRGMVNPGNGKAGLLISGFVIQEPTMILFRMMADSLTRFGVQTGLKDTSFEIYKLNSGELATAELVGSNDNWKEAGQQYLILSTALAPGNDNESALVLNLEPGSYTLNANSEKGAGIALVETYGMQFGSISSSMNGAANGGLNSEFSIFNAALKFTGLDNLLNGPGPFTVFAPNDEAFLNLFTQEELDELVADDADKADDMDALSGLLLSHVVAGYYPGQNLTDGFMATLTSIMGTDIDIAVAGDEVSIGNATALEGNIPATNGVVHVIDTVLE